MSRRLAPFRRLTGLAIVAFLGLIAAPGARAGQAEGKEGLVELGQTDPRLRGYYAPKGFRIRVVAIEPNIVDPACMAFDDQGGLFVAEWRPADRSMETWDTLALPEGGTTRVRRGRKTTTDVVKKLKDGDGDGVFESAEVVLEGCEMPTCLLPWKSSLYLACVGRLEKWSDEDGDGKYETKAVLADGFAAIDRRGLGGITMGADGWLYLTVGDNDSHVVGHDESRVDLIRTGGVFRCKVDGSQMHLFAMGLRNPGRGLAFNGTFAPFLLDGDQEDGSKFQGARLVNPAEGGDYGWRLRPGASRDAADFDRAAVDGERPGKLPVVARIGRGSPGGPVIYNSLALPDACRDLVIDPDPVRRTVRGFRVEPKAGSHAFKGQTTLLTADDDHFRPVQAAVGADGALYILDRRGHPEGEGPPWGEGKSGRVYQITWEGDGTTPALPIRPNNWQRLFQATTEHIVFQHMASFDYAEADRALRELLERGPTAISWCLGWATKTDATLHTRLLGIQGARQLWNDQVEGTMLTLLNDPQPDVRRLAAQALAWEPKAALPRLVPKLVPHLDDPDGRVVREVALAIGRHAEPRPQQTAAVLLRWLLAHPKSDAPVKDALLRALERLGDAGVEEIALAIRTRRGAEREMAVALFSALRSAPAAEQLDGLVKIPDLSGPERLALVRQFQDIPLDIPVPTQGLAEWVAKHDDAEPAVKFAALDACQLAGNPASSLVLGLLDDEEESVRLAATRVAARLRPPGALTKLVERLKDKEVSASERLAIVRALRFAGPKVVPALDAAYLASEDSIFRRAALRSMAEDDRAKTTAALESALSGPDPALRTEAVRILGESPRTAVLLGKAFLDRTLGRAELPAVLASLRKHDGADVRKLLATIEGNRSTSPANDPTRIDPAEIRKAAQEGDPWAGLGVFFRESSRCSSCHTIEGRGVAVGPPIGLASSALPTDKLIASILSPSKEIKERYETSKVIFKEGRELTGIVTARDSETLTLRKTDGREVRLSHEAIGEEVRVSSSLMPANVALDLTPEEIANLVAFLQSKTAQDALKHGPRRLDRVLAIGPFAPGADKLRMPLDRVDPVKPLAGQDGASVSWIALEASGTGALNLRGEFGPKPGRAYLAVQVRSARDQSAALRVGVEGAARIYLNGAKVADVADRDPADLSSAFLRPRPGHLAPLPDLARLPLKAGWNLLVVALDHSGTSDAHAAFEIASPEPIETRTPKN